MYIQTLSSVLKSTAMDNAKRTDIGYTFWLVSHLQSEKQYVDLIQRMHREEYTLTSNNVYMILDDRSKSAIPAGDIQRINVDMILAEDTAVRSILLSMSKPLIMISESIGNKVSPYDLKVKKMLSILIARLMGSTFCTLIDADKDIHIVDVIHRSISDKAIEYGTSTQDANKDVIESTISEQLNTMKSIQFNRGNPILTLRRLTSYLINIIQNKPNIFAASVLNRLGLPIDQGKKVIGDSLDITPQDIEEGYILFNLNNMYGYSFDTENLFPLLKIMGKKLYTLSSILLNK